MLLEFKNVSKIVNGETHIFPTHLSMESGSFNILLGTTLSGKTTLLKLMAGLERPSVGELWFNGKNVTQTAVQNRNVSMVYQQFINYPNFSVYENIASPLRVIGTSEQEIKRKVDSVAELLKLTDFFDRKPSELSGGQQQRTAIARSLVKDADLVLLDEPLANLDFKLREELRDELPKLFEDRDCIVVYATTEPIEALLFGGQTATLFEGNLVQFGPTSKIYREPINLVSAQVFSEPPLNTCKIKKVGSSLKFSDEIVWDTPKNLDSVADAEYTLGIRPHHVTPDARGDFAVSLSGQILVTEISGSESVMHFKFGEQTWVSQTHGIHPYKVGERADLFADLSNAYLFDKDNQLVNKKPQQE